MDANGVTSNSRSPSYKSEKKTSSPCRSLWERFRKLKTSPDAHNRGTATSKAELKWINEGKLVKRPKIYGYPPDARERTIQLLRNVIERGGIYTVELWNHGILKGWMMGLADGGVWLFVKVSELYVVEKFVDLYRSVDYVYCWDY